MAATSAPVAGERAVLKAALAAAGAAALLLGGSVGLDVLLRPDTFPVRRVSLEGGFQHVSRDLLGEAVAEPAHGNFYTLDLQAVRRAAESVPWVQRASVRRRWPDGVEITIREHELVARWNNDAWVNTDGERADLHGQDGPPGLPQFEGPAGTQDEVLAHYRRLGAVLAPLGLRIARLRLTARYAWELVLAEDAPATDGGRAEAQGAGARRTQWVSAEGVETAGGASGLQLVLGREHVEERLKRFVRHYPALAADAARMRQVDLRYTNGFAVEWLAPGRKRQNEG